VLTQPTIFQIHGKSAIARVTHACTDKGQGKHRYAKARQLLEICAIDRIVMIRSLGAAGRFSDVEFVFVDRDGVINEKAPTGEYVYDWEHFRPLPGVEAAIAMLNNSGRKIIVVTNQRGVALGRYQLRDVEQLHAHLQRHLARFGARVDAFYVCPHDRNQCDCRKPKTGLLERAFRDFPQAKQNSSVLIGDSLSDIQAAKNFEIRSILLRRQLPDLTLQQDEALKLATVTSGSLPEAVEIYF
jgi:D-glycero-D-manno-heptose 1,7-bisphosphate phosphatase